MFVIKLNCYSNFVYHAHNLSALATNETRHKKQKFQNFSIPAKFGDFFYGLMPLLPSHFFSSLVISLCFFSTAAVRWGGGCWCSGVNHWKPTQTILVNPTNLLYRYTQTKIGKLTRSKSFFYKSFWVQFKK